MDAAAELVALVEQLQQAEDAGIKWNRKHRERFLKRLETLVAEAFPSYRELASEIALALLGDGPMPLPPRWWEREQLETTAPSAEDEALAILLGSRDPEYFPDSVGDPLTQGYLDSVYRMGEDAPVSYLVFALLSFLRSLLWGYHRFWRLEKGRLVSVRQLLVETYGLDAETADGLSVLSRRHGAVPMAVNRQAEVILSSFFSLPGSLKLLDDIATVYGDVVVGLRQVGEQDGLCYPRTPVPRQATERFRERVRIVHRIVGSAQLAAKALRLRKATLLTYLKGEDSGDEGV